MYQIYGEKCYGQKQPAALAALPDFSWRLSGDGQNITQESYQIRVFDCDFREIWDSGRVLSEEQHNIPYGGKPLSSAEDYFWQVTSTASSGESATSGIHAFSTGILEEALWKADWIEADIPPCEKDDCLDMQMVMDGQIPERKYPEESMNPAQYFRREFGISRKVRKAKAFVTAHGIYQLSVNGDEYGYPLAPGYTVYEGYQEYQCYNITDSLRVGTNVVGAILADGWYRGKMGFTGVGNQYGETTALLLQIMITYEDGEHEIVGSDSAFTAGTGAYGYADLFVGEGYDAAKEPAGWMEPGYSNEEWKPVLIRDYGYSQLKGSADEPAKYVRIQRPAAVIRTPDDGLVIDAGENIAGFVEISAEAKKGTRVTLEYSEILDEHGNFLKNIIGQNKNQTDAYIAGKDGAFTYRPRFTYHGFQYVRVTGLPDLKPEDVRVYVLSSDLERTGRFECSNEKINQLMGNIFRSQQGNMVYIPTDCPQREKSGFTGDIQVYAPTAATLMDVEAFLRKWLENCRLAQYPDGQVPNTVPDIPSARMVTGDARSSAAWGDACVIVPYRLYQAYGDIRILKDNYEMMQRWMRYVEKEAATGIPEDLRDLTDEQREHQKYLWNTGFHFGDWLIPSLSRDGASNAMDGAKMTKELVAPAIYAYTTSLMEEIAALAGDEEASRHYRDINRKIRKAYAHEYITGKGRLKLDYQGMYVLALQMKLIPEGQVPEMAERLVELIRQAGGCLDTGFVSMPFLLDALYDHGKEKEAFQLLYQEKAPSWLYEVAQGANTIWESWTNIQEDGKRNNSSYNHFAFGCVGDFIYRKILGVTIAAPGYRRVRIAPDLECGMRWAKGSVETVHGRIEVFWEKTEGGAVLELALPPNITAEVDFQGRHCVVGSGHYHFE